MPWTETDSLSFTARFEEGDEECAERTLDQLEDLRLRLEERFERAPGGVTVILHPSSAWLSAAHPFLPAARLAAAPAGRRYLAGWATRTELHTLNDNALERRAGGADSLRALLGTPDRLYAQLVLAANNPRIPPPWGPRAFVRYLKWAWLDRGRRPVLRGPVLGLPAGGSAPAQRGRHPVLSALRPRRDHPRRAASSICSTVRSAARVRPARQPAAEERADDRSGDRVRSSDAGDRTALAGPRA